MYYICPPVTQVQACVTVIQVPSSMAYLYNKSVYFMFTVRGTRALNQFIIYIIILGIELTSQQSKCSRYKLRVLAH